jgi:hypothetical protein
MCCLSEPKVYDVLADQARRVCDLFDPKTVLFSHDEIRVANWCKACTDRKLPPGQLLADNVKRCRAILEKVRPGTRAAIWSDMFDPHHNAVDGYYLVNGSLAGAWEGLDPEITVVNWNSGKAAESLRFFADRGHSQVMAGYYDTDSLDGLTPWLRAATGVTGVDGFMYTTWQGRFDWLARYGQALPPRPRPTTR